MPRTMRSTMKLALIGFTAWGVCGCTPAGGGEGNAGTSLIVTDSVDFVDFQNREAMLAQLSDGTLLVTGFPRLPHEPARAPSLWRSGDGGQSWQRVDVGSPDDGAIGNSDVDLAVAPDGTIYFVTMGFNRTNATGTHISVGVSPDNGVSWEWTNLTRKSLVDRPWVDVAPDGTAHIIWNDDEGVSHVSSKDRGVSWTQESRINPQGGSSHLAIGPNGELAVRMTPIAASGNALHEGVDLIAVSTDGGETWNKGPAPGHRLWEDVLPGGAGLPRWVEPLAWDGDGRLLYLWSEGSEVWLGRSADQGETWVRWRIQSHDQPAYYPYMVAGSDGRLAATWFSGFGEIALHVALIHPDTAGEGAPEITIADPIEPRSWLEIDGTLQGDTAGEYITAIFLADGGVGVVTPLQDPRADRFGFTWWRLELQDK